MSSKWVGPRPGCFVRVPELARATVSRALDMRRTRRHGAHARIGGTGLSSWCAWAKYAPLGGRGFGGAGATATSPGSAPIHPGLHGEGQREPSPSPRLKPPQPHPATSTPSPPCPASDALLIGPKISPFPWDAPATFWQNAWTRPSARWRRPQKNRQDFGIALPGSSYRTLAAERAHSRDEQSGHHMLAAG